LDSGASLVAGAVIMVARRPNSRVCDLEMLVFELARPRQIGAFFCGSRSLAGGQVDREALSHFGIVNAAVACGPGWTTQAVMKVNPPLISAHPRERIAYADRMGADEIPRSGGERLAARSLQKEVLAALVGSGYAALTSVGCEVNGERVVLFGDVPTYHLKQLAQVFAQRGDGVGKVVNRIAVFT
jgi:hypothetical protein